MLDLCIPEKIKNNKMHNFEYTKTSICQVLEEYEGHNCKYCAHNPKKKQDYEEPEIDEDLI